MSLAGDLLRERLERRARALAADLRTALLRSYDLLRKRLTDQELERLASGEDLAQVVTDPDARRALDLVQRELRDGVEASGRVWAQDVPGVGRGIAFNVLNPDVVTAIQGLNTRVMQTFTDTVREAIRTQTEIGIRAGVNPRTTARRLREVVGLAPNQVRAIENFRRMLEEGDREALTRALRDRRFDGTLARAFDGDGLTEAQIDRMTEAYRRRMQAFHAETIARTAALDAQRLGQHLTWQGAVERGDVDGDQLTKRWSGTLDDRERATHLAMEGETVAWDALYSNGQMMPGDSEYNCFPAGTAVEGAFVAGLKAMYAGPLREIKTARGHWLTVTPNHPILTPQGWMAAGQLNKGSDLFSQLRQVGLGGTAGNHIDNQDGPTGIEEVFESLSTCGPGSRRRIASLDLHGDGQFVCSEIDIVGANVDLGREDRTDLTDGLDDWIFDATNMSKSFATGGSTFYLNRKAVAAPAPRGVRRTYLAPDRCGVALDLYPFEPLCYGSAADWNTPFAEPSKQDDALVPAFVRELLEASAGEIALDKVVEIRDFEASTHVYDLQSVGGWMIAQGIVTSNCRCVSIYSTRSRPKAGAGAYGIAGEQLVRGAAR